MDTRSSVRLLLIRLLIAAAATVATIAVRLGLDEAIAPAPWFVVTFMATLFAAWIGGPPAGLLAVAAIVLAELAGVARVSFGEPSLVAASPAIDLVFGLLAVLTGGVIRVTRHRERRSLAKAARATRESVNADRRWHLVADAIPEFATVATPLQVEDALVRHATTLAGRPVTLDRDGSGAGALHVDSTRHSRPSHRRQLPRDGSDVPSDTGDPGRGIGEPPGDLGVPVFAAGRLVGVLRVDQPTGQPSKLAADDIVGLTALATLAADALERIRLRSASGTSIESAEQSGQRLARLQSLTTRLAALVTPEAIGEVVVGHVLHVLDAPVGLFYLIDAAGDLRLAHARGYPIGLAGRDARLAPNERLPATDALREGRAIVVTSPDDWRQRYPGASDRLGMTGTQSIVAWPIGSPPMAVMVLQRTREGRPTNDELSQIEMVGHQAMQAIERARVYAQEREAREVQEAFVGIMSHELRTPITTILAGSKLMSRDRAMSDRSRGLATDIEAEADRLFRLVEDLLVLSRLERGNLAVGDEPVHLMRVLQRVVGSESARWPDTTFVLPRDRAGHLVRGDETYVEQIVRNLLTNAAKYSPPGSAVRVEIDDREGEVAVRVLDEGPGVPDAEVERLFALFYRSPTTAASAAGAGIGLFVCRRLVGAMGGRIWAHRREEGGSEFGFSLARYPVDDLDEVEPTKDEGDDAMSRSGRLVAAGMRESVDNGHSAGGEAR